MSPARGPIVSNDQRPVSNVPFDPTAHKQMTHETSWLGATGRHESRPPRSTDGDGQTDHPLRVMGRCSVCTTERGFGNKRPEPGRRQGCAGNAGGDRAISAVFSCDWCVPPGFGYVSFKLCCPHLPQAVSVP